MMTMCPTGVRIVGGQRVSECFFGGGAVVIGPGLGLRHHSQVAVSPPQINNILTPTPTMTTISTEDAGSSVRLARKASKPDDDSDEPIDDGYMGRDYDAGSDTGNAAQPTSNNLGADGAELTVGGDDWGADDGWGSDGEDTSPVLNQHTPVASSIGGQPLDAFNLALFEHSFLLSLVLSLFLLALFAFRRGQWHISFRNAAV